jgi:hypothetical protein
MGSLQLRVHRKHFLTNPGVYTQPAYIPSKAPLHLKQSSPKAARATGYAIRARAGVHAYEANTARYFKPYIVLL